jgi:large subunit ribosomal protein L18
MKKETKKLYSQQKKRYLKKVQGSQERPRLSVFRSNKHIYAQLIDDKTSSTLAFCSTLDKELKQECQNSATQEASFKVGKLLGERAKSKEIRTVVFDRGTRPYHGRVKSIADGAREAGLSF